jgi:hypothetical protein
LKGIDKILTCVRFSILFNPGFFWPKQIYPKSSKKMKLDMRVDGTVKNMATKIQLQNLFGAAKDNIEFLCTCFPPYQMFDVQTTEQGSYSLFSI